MPGGYFIQSIVVPAISPVILRIAIMAFVACSGMQRLRMAGSTALAAMVHAAALFIGNPRVGAAILCRPVVDRMAGNTI